MHKRLATVELKGGVVQSTAQPGGPTNMHAQPLKKSMSILRQLPTFCLSCDARMEDSRTGMKTSCMFDHYTSV
jgi:hypothetical protein